MSTKAPPAPTTIPAAVPLVDLTRAIKNALIFAGKDQTLPAIWAVRFTWDAEWITVQSTDRYRIFAEKIMVNQVTAPPGRPFAAVTVLTPGVDFTPGTGDVTIYRSEVEKLLKRLAASDKDETAHLETEGERSYDATQPDKLIVTTKAYMSREGDYTGRYPIHAGDDGLALANIAKFTDKIKWGSEETVKPEWRFNREFLADVLTRVDPGGSKNDTPVQLCFATPSEHLVGFRYDRADGRGGITGAIMAVRAPKTD